MPQPDKARVRLTEDQVPAPPSDSEGHEQPNGDRLFIAGDQRWRFNRNGELKYYMRLQAGKDRSVLPYEELYQSNSARRR